MKYLATILFCLTSFFGISQTISNNYKDIFNIYPSTRTATRAEAFGYLYGDSGMYVGTRDTLFTPTRAGTLEFTYGSFYGWDGTKWVAFSSGSGGGQNIMNADLTMDANHTQTLNDKLQRWNGFNAGDGSFSSLIFNYSGFQINATTGDELNHNSFVLNPTLLSMGDSTSGGTVRISVTTSTDPIYLMGLGADEKNHYYNPSALGGVTNVSGITNRITSTGGTTPVIDISSTFENLLLKKANNLSDLANAATARTNLGGTTVGSNIFTATNPSAITFLRANADNSVSFLDAATFRTAIGAGTGSGTVTSVSGTANQIASTGGTTPILSLVSGGTLPGAWALGTPASLTLTNATGLLVAGGGTGISTTTAYGTITGGTTSTGAFQNAGTGTTGQVLTSNGNAALPTWQTPTTGTVTGSGTATQLAYWSSSSALTSSANLFWDNSNVALGIGTSTPLTALHVIENSTSNLRGLLTEQYSNTTSSARIFTRKSRGTSGTPTVITTGDFLGAWVSSGYDGSAFVDAARILTTSTGTISTGIIPTTMTFSTSNSSGTLTTGINIDASQIISLPHYTTNGGIFYANGSGALSQTSAGTSTTLLHGGTSPAYSAISLTADVTGVLPVANGGTNASSASITAFNNITGYTASGATGTTSTNLVFSTNPTLSGLTFADATNIVLNTTTGTKIGTATGQKIGFYNTTPVVQQTGSVITGLNNLGLFTGATITASDVTLANLTATDATLTFSGTYNGSTARTIGLNLGNANTWAAVQTFSTPVINGLATGTGVASAATASTIMARDANANANVNNTNFGYTTTATAAGTTTLTVGSTLLNYFTGSTTQTVVLPVASTLVLGQRYIIANNSSGVVTVNSSGGNAVMVLAANTATTVTCILTSGTDAASWSTTIGLVSSVSNADGSLTVSPTTGAVVASVNMANQNIWTVQQNITRNTTTTTLIGLNLRPTNNASAGTTVRVAPAIVFRARGWNSTSVASEDDDFNIDAVPVPGNPTTAYLRFSASINGGTAAEVLRVTSGGNLVVGTANNIQGTATNNNATAGNVGEEINSTISTYTNYTTTATYQNITSIALTAGDWDIAAFGTFSSNTATITAASNAIFVISTTTASAAGATEGQNIAYIPQATLLGTSRESIGIPSFRVSLSGNTTYYLNTQATFTLGNPQYVGGIRARRVR